MEQLEAKSTRRRYPEGLEFYYDFNYLSAVRSSDVLKGSYQAFELDSLLDERKERLAFLEEDLEDHTASQKHSRQTAFNKGIKWKEDDRSRERRVTLEARIDVCKWEIETLERAIEDAENEKEERDLPPCLPRGPEGLNQVRGSIGKGYVDGQWCEHLKNVGLVIVDERSPYRGMTVTDYTTHIVKSWKHACRVHTDKRKKELLAAGVPEEKIKHRYKVPWPKYPVYVKNHLSNGKATEQPVKMVRTKK